MHATQLEKTIQEQLHELRETYEHRYGRDLCVSVILDMMINCELSYDDQLVIYNSAIYGRLANGLHTQDNLINLKITCRRMINRAKSPKALQFYTKKLELLKEIQGFADGYYGNG